MPHNGDLVKHGRDFENATVLQEFLVQEFLVMLEVPLLEISKENYIYAIPPQFKVGKEPGAFDPEHWSLKRGIDSDESYVFPTAAYIEHIKAGKDEYIIISDELKAELQGESPENQNEIWKNVYLKVLKTVDPDDKSSRKAKRLILSSITVYPGKPEWQQLAAEAQVAVQAAMQAAIQAAAQQPVAAAAQQSAAEAQVAVQVAVQAAAQAAMQAAMQAAAQQPAAAAAQQQGGRRKSTRRRKYRARKTRSRR